jgi:hypothetical protein
MFCCLFVVRMVDAIFRAIFLFCNQTASFTFQYHGKTVIRNQKMADDRCDDNVAEDAEDDENIDWDAVLWKRETASVLEYPVDTVDGRKVIKMYQNWNGKFGTKSMILFQLAS